MVKIAEDELRHRLKAVLERLGTLAFASEISGVSTDQIAKWRDGKARAPFGPLVILCEKAGVSMDWLAFGREPMLMADMPPPDERPSAEEWLRSGEDENLVYVPLSTAVASAGAGIQNDGVEEFRRLPFSRSLLREHGIAPDNAHFVTARGDSMEPTIHDGGIVLFDASRRSLHEPGVYVLTVDGDLLIKRVQPATRGLMLISDNERYKPEVIDRGDLDGVNVVGKVFWVGSKL